MLYLEAAGSNLYRLLEKIKRSLDLNYLFVLS